ncbi:hypothetical protein ACROYT_G042884 [Oculina patagonica]
MNRRLIRMVILPFILTYFSSSVQTTVRYDIRSSITHHWTFNETFPYKDHVTGQEAKFIGTTRPLNNTDYLSLVGRSCLILGSFTDSCLTNMPVCNSGYSLAFWLQITPSATAPQIFLGTSRNNATDLQGIFVYQTESIRTERRVIVEFLFDGLSWKVPLKVQQEIWEFIVLTWNKTSGRLTAYMNGEKVDSSSARNGSDVSKHVKLRGSFPGQVVRASLYLESGALYDQIMAWNRSLDGYEVKRAFQLQMNELSKINCTATATTLNITWQAIRRNVFKTRSHGYRVTVSRERTQIVKVYLHNSTNHYFMNDLVPNTSYKIRLWREDSDARKRLGALVCRTREGVPTKVQNVTIVAQNSTSLLVQWSPPAQINGILQGYNIKLSIMGKDRYRLIAVKGGEEYLVTHLMADTEYTIAVQGFTSSGVGPLSESAMAKTNKVPTVTEMPKSINAFAVSWDAINVTWTPLDRKEEVMSYEVKYCSIECSTIEVYDNSVLVKGLLQYTSFTIMVRGRNAKYAGPWTTSREVKTLDFDECSGHHSCSEHALCINTAGSYECRCKSGLTGDGYWCEVVSTDSSDDDFCKMEVFRNITWMRTPKGKTIKRPCPYGFTGEASRTCSAENKASWHKPDLTKCVSKRFKKLQYQINSETINSDTAVSLANELSKITKPARDELVVRGDLRAAVHMLETLDQKTTKNVTMSKEKANAFMENVVQVANNLLGGKAMEAWQDSSAKSRSDEASKLLTSIENIALMTASVSNSKNTSNVKTSNVVLRFRSFGKQDFIPERVAFSAVDDGPGSGIEMPASELHRESNSTDSGTNSHIAFIYLNNIAELLTTASSNGTQNNGEKNESDATVNTGVISLSTNPKISGNFTKPVVITLQNNQSDESLQPSCVFWKYTGDGGSWSTEGCYVNFANSTHSVCHCYHLTSFSVLMQLTPESYEIRGTYHELALSLITYTGISISLVALVLALITFCSLAFLRSNRNFAHINLVLSLILAELLFVVGIDKTQYETGCFVIAVFLHYLFLVAFCWMATEGVILYLMLVKVFPTSGEGPKKKVFFVCSWGIPIIPVVTAILVNQEGYTTDRHCWLAVEDGFVWSFVGPVLFICVLNLVFLGMTFRAMASRTAKQPSQNQQQMRYWAKACAVLTCLLGTTWLLGLFFLGKATVVMAYLFNIFNVLQGLFIFIFHCLADERIRAEYKRIISCHGSRRDHLRNEAVARSRHNKYSSTMSSRIAEKKVRVSEEKRLSLGDDTVIAEACDSFGVVLTKQDPIECSDHNLEIASLSGAAENNKYECSKTFQHSHSTESDQEEIVQDQDDEIKSDDVFFEDISSSLINIRQPGEAKVSSDSKSKQVSIISNPFQDTQICVPDQNSDQNEVMNLPNQFDRGMRSWRVINVTNQDSIQETLKKRMGMSRLIFQEISISSPITRDNTQLQRDEFINTVKIHITQPLPLHGLH